MEKAPLVLHFVTWYPSENNHAEGIFIQRHVELLADNKTFRHVVVRKNPVPTGILEHLKSFFGFFSTKKVGTIDVVYLPEESRLYRFFFWRFRKQFEQFLIDCLYKKFQPAIAHLHVVYGFGKEAVYLKKSKQVPFIVSEHMGPFPFDWLGDKEYTVLQPMQIADEVVAVSSAQARQINAFTGIEPLIIPNLVNETEFYFDESFRTQKTSKSIQLVFTGIYAKAKGVDYLLSALPAFVQQYPNTVLHLVGGATEDRMKELKTVARKNDIEQNLVFHGNLQPAAINKLYNQCDFYVCASEWESFGLSVLEGLFAGLPALCTSCGGVRDFVNQENGILISNDQQTQTLLDGLLQMAATYQQYNRKKIAMDVKLKFSAATIREQYLNIYNRVQRGTPAS